MGYIVYTSCGKGPFQPYHKWQIAPPQINTVVLKSIPQHPEEERREPRGQRGYAALRNELMPTGPEPQATPPDVLHQKQIP